MGDDGVINLVVSDEVWMVLLPVLLEARIEMYVAARLVLRTGECGPREQVT